MSDITERPYLDTVAIRAALVFPGDTPPHMGFDTVRIPVRVVLRSLDPVTPVATGGASAGLFRDPPTAVRADGGTRGSDPADGFAAAPEPEPAPSGLVSGADPVPRFRKVNEALDRITGGAAPEAPNAGVVGKSGQEHTDPTAPVPVVDDRGMPIQGARGPMSRPASLPPEFFVKQGLQDRSVIADIVMQNGVNGFKMAYQYELKQLANFKQGGPWDAQRAGGHFTREYRDYATAAIGLYAAAVGIPRPVMLEVENIYAAQNSEFDRVKPSTGSTDTCRRRMCVIPRPATVFTKRVT